MLSCQILHIPVSIETNLDSVFNAINRESWDSEKAISLFSKILSQVSLSCNHGNQVFFPHTTADVVSERCSTAMSKKDDLGRFLSLCPPSTLFSPISFPLYVTLITDSLITHFFSPLSALYLQLPLISTPIPHIHTPLSLSLFIPSSTS